MARRGTRRGVESKRDKVDVVDAICIIRFKSFLFSLSLKCSGSQNGKSGKQAMVQLEFATLQSLKKY